LAEKFGGVHELIGSFRTVVEKTVDRKIEGFRHLPKEKNGDVAMTGFELREVALGDARIARQDAASHAAAGAGITDADAQALQINSGSWIDALLLGSCSVRLERVRRRRCGIMLH
jgi:hypothetical protein